ncbi:hypothetical protein C5F51_36305 [Nocardia nova]|uniref:Uncharacterized protein n=1 Tax=Nocardia nova TaxID=37330 RepID=A0A2S5ZUE5_9NOCA|nr:hypothetical protein C5F51_36305 [Nocardia nova]
MSETRKHDFVGSGHHRVVDVVIMSRVPQHRVCTCLLQSRIGGISKDYVGGMLKDFAVIFQRTSKF